MARQWALQAETDFGMECTYNEGAVEDTLSFKRSGVNGHLQVRANNFELSAQLGFLLRSFKGKIEAEISKNLDQLLERPADSA
jgi:putative polyhydroxyalkanoate system protein